MRIYTVITHADDIAYGNESWKKAMVIWHVEFPSRQFPISTSEIGEWSMMTNFQKICALRDIWAHFFGDEAKILSRYIAQRMNWPAEVKEISYSEVDTTMIGNSKWFVELPQEEGYPFPFGVCGAIWDWVDYISDRNGSHTGMVADLNDGSELSDEDERNESERFDTPEVRSELESLEGHLRLAHLLLHASGRGWNEATDYVNEYVDSVLPSRHPDRDSRSLASDEACGIRVVE